MARVRPRAVLSIAFGAGLAMLLPGALNAQEVIHACVDPRSGTLRVLLVPSECKKDEVPVAWNVQEAEAADDPQEAEEAHAPQRGLGLAESPDPATKDVSKRIRSGARVFIARAKSGFGAYMAAALHEKDVPLVVVTDRASADFEIISVAESEQSGYGWIRNFGAEQATISVVNLRSGVVAFAYAVKKSEPVHSKQSVAEACAKHLKWYIEDNGSGRRWGWRIRPADRE